MQLPVADLLANQASPEDSCFQLFLKHVGVELVKRQVLKPGMDWIRRKSYTDCTYIDVPQIGVSFAFDKHGDAYVLAAIHVFNNVRQYRYCDWLELPFDLSLNLTIKELVTHLGEPPKKSGGRGIPITIIYDALRMNAQIGLQCEFNGTTWEDPDNTLQCLTFFKPTAL